MKADLELQSLYQRKAQIEEQLLQLVIPTRLILLAIILGFFIFLCGSVATLFLLYPDHPWIIWFKPYSFIAFWICAVLFIIAGLLTAIRTTSSLSKPQRILNRELGQVNRRINEMITDQAGQSEHLAAE